MLNPALLNLRQIDDLPTALLLPPVASGPSPLDRQPTFDASRHLSLALPHCQGMFVQT